MNINLKKIIPLLGLGAFLATSPAFAYENDTMKKSHKAQHAVPPAQYPAGEETLAFYVGAAYTYWVPYQEGMDVAVLNMAPNQETPGNTIGPVMNGVSGFKVSLGANTNHDGWQGALQYTWFYNSPAYKVATLLDGTYSSTFDDNADDIQAVQTRFANQFNRIDGVLDRAFYAGHYLAFRPWIGLLGAWETQSLGADMDTQTTISFTHTTESYRNTQDWWGLGPYTGCDATFYFTNEWGVFLSSGVAMLLGNHTVNQKEYGYTAESTEADKVIGATSFNLKTPYSSVEPMLEATLGLRWDSFWTDWALRVELGWEVQTYFEHNGFQSQDVYITGPSGANYSMQGLTLCLRANF